MEIKKLTVYGNVTSYEVKDEEFEGIIQIAENTGLSYVRHIYPSKGGEVMQCFHKMETITNKVIEYHKSLKDGN